MTTSTTPNTNPAPNMAVEAIEREKFEAWAKSEWADRSVPDNAWLGWNARAALARPLEVAGTGRGGVEENPDLKAAVYYSQIARTRDGLPFMTDCTVHGPWTVRIEFEDGKRYPSKVMGAHEVFADSHAPVAVGVGICSNCPHPLSCKIAENPCPRLVVPSVEAVEAEIGMGAGAWDCVEPKSLIDAVVKLATPAHSVPLGGGEERDALIERVDAMLGDVYHCTRVWSAWQVGTMGEEDFTEARGSSLAGEIVDEILANAASVPAGVQGDAARDINKKYWELLYAVGNKYPGESRHETALRYIRKAEEPTSAEASASESAKKGA